MMTANWGWTLRSSWGDGAAAGLEAGPITIGEGRFFDSGRRRRAAVGMLSGSQIRKPQAAISVPEVPAIRLSRPWRLCKARRCATRCVELRPSVAGGEMDEAARSQRRR